MTRSISSGLAAHYAGGTTTVCACWKITRTDGEVFGFADHDQPIVYGGITYEARAGFMPTTFKGQTRLAVDNLDANGAIDSDQITTADLLAGLWDFASVEIFLINWADTTQGVDTMLRGRIGEVSHDRNRFRAELRGLVNAYSQSHGQIYRPACAADFCDTRCGLDIADWTVTGTIDSVSTDGRVIFDAARTEPGPTGGKAISGITKATAPTVTCTAHGFKTRQVVYIAGVVGMTEMNGRYHVITGTPTANTFTIGTDTSGYSTYTSGGTATPQGDAGYFDGGKITMTSGASSGLSMEVKGYDKNVLTLQMSLPFGAAAGDTYSLTAGCAKRFAEDCVTRFSNGINFRGMPHLPGMDRVLTVGGQ